MLGVDIDKLIQPFVDAQEEFSTDLKRIIELLEEISAKLDN